MINWKWQKGVILSHQNLWLMHSFKFNSLFYEEKFSNLLFRHAEMTSPFSLVFRIKSLNFRITMEMLFRFRPHPTQFLVQIFQSSWILQMSSTQFRFCFYFFFRVMSCSLACNLDLILYWIILNALIWKTLITKLIFKFNICL